MYRGVVFTQRHGTKSARSKAVGAAPSGERDEGRSPVKGGTPGGIRTCGLWVRGTVLRRQRGLHEPIQSSTSRMWRRHGCCGSRCSGRLAHAISGSLRILHKACGAASSPWRTCFHWKKRPRQASGDTTYGTREIIIALEDAGISAYVPLPDFDRRVSVVMPCVRNRVPHPDRGRTSAILPLRVGHQTTRPGVPGLIPSLNNRIR